MSSEIHPPSSDQCPTFDQLQAFNRGALDLPALDSISRHVQSCERCALLLLSVSDAASAAYAPAAADAAEVSTPQSRAEATQHHPTQAVDPGATVSLAADSTPRTIGRYAVLRVLGKGGFGVVYLARDGELDRLVAVKAPHLERIKRAADLEAYRREARLHANVDHAHVVPIYDVGTAEDTPFFVVSKFVPGIDLSARLRGAPPDFRSAAQWVATLAEALDHVHKQGVIHRDVKPRNIMVDPAGRVYLMDFGLAKQAALHNGAEPIVGTPAYMAPEQARGEPLDGRCDVYALGMVLYEALTGQRPFKGDPTSVMQQVLTIEPPLPRSIRRAIPRDLEAVCVKALAKDRERRYQTAADLADDLRRWLRDEPLRLARRVGLVERAWSWTRRHRAVAALGGVAVVALALSGIAWVRTSEPLLPTLPVTVATEPPGAALFYVPIDAQTGLPDPRSKLAKRGTAGETIDLAKGTYFVVAHLTDGRFHEVFRHVPGGHSDLGEPYWHTSFQSRDGVVHLPPIRIPEQDVIQGMALLPESRAFEMGFDGTPMFHRRRVPSFYLDPNETTIDDYMKVKIPFRFTKAPVMPGNTPATNVRWDLAMQYAEAIGKRLPFETEYEYAATALGTITQPPRDLLRSWAPAASGKPDWDRIELDGQPPLFGLRSNAAEWTASWQVDPTGASTSDPNRRVVRGGPDSVIDGSPNPLETETWTPTKRVFRPRQSERPGLGFRCARSSRPPLKSEDFESILKNGS